MTAVDVRARRLRWIAAIAVLALVIAALAGFNPLEPQGPPAASDVPTPSGNAPAGATATLQEGHLILDYPAGWRVFHYEIVSSFTTVLAYLGTIDVPDPCVRTASSVACTAAYRLDPRTLVVTITAASFPGGTALDHPGPGAVRVEVGGLPGLREQAPLYPAVGADTAIVWRFARPDSIDNWYMIRADIHGPDLDAIIRDVEAVIDTVRWDPPLEPPNESPPG